MTPFAHSNLILPQYSGPFIAFFIVLGLIPILRRFAPMVGLVDRPGGRKKHQTPIPLVGGVAIFIGIAITTLLFPNLLTFKGLLLGSTSLFLLGLIDDRFDINAKLRFVVQGAVVAVSLYIDEIWLYSLGNIGGVELNIGPFAYPLTILAIMGVTNAINMLDGLDGLASGIMMLTLFFILGTASHHNQDVATLSIVSLGAIVAFWLYNYRFPWRERASVFMGDSGTMFLGFFLPYLAIYLTTKTNNTQPIEPTYLLWLFSLPLWDITAVVLKRIKEGRSPFSAGRDHIHHILLNHGLTVRQAVLFIYGITALSLSLGTSLVYFGFETLGLIFGFFFSLYLYIERMFKYDNKHNNTESSEVVEIIPLKRVANSSNHSN
jgi:UDP-GlcNAc:undecaprenyl-phosphate GlcNAc-1-phosphate transferase